MLVRGRRLPALDRFLLQHVASRRGGEGVGHEHDHLPLAMRTQALLARVLVFDFKDMPVRALNLDSHVGRPPQSLRNYGRLPTPGREPPPRATATDRLAALPFCL